MGERTHQLKPTYLNFGEFLDKDFSGDLKLSEILNIQKRFGNLNFLDGILSKYLSEILKYGLVQVFLRMGRLEPKIQKPSTKIKIINKKYTEANLHRITIVARHGTIADQFQKSTFWKNEIAIRFL